MILEKIPKKVSKLLSFLKALTYYGVFIKTYCIFGNSCEYVVIWFPLGKVLCYWTP